MSNLQYLLHRLQPFVVYCSCPNEQRGYPEHIELLGGQTEFTADRIYLGDISVHHFFKDFSFEPGTVFLFSGAMNATPIPDLPDDATVMLFSCSMATLHNTLAAQIAQISGWRDAFQKLANKGGGVHATLSLASELSEGAVVLLDQNGRVLVSAGMEKSTYLSAELAETGVLPQQTMDRIFSEEASKVHSGLYAVSENGRMLYGYRNIIEDETLSILLLENTKSRADLDICSLCECIAAFLHQRMFSYTSERIGSSARAFERCWEDIMDRKLMGNVEVRNALCQMQHPISQFVRIAIVSFGANTTSVPYNYLLTRFREIFPETNITFYRNDIVILLSYQERNFRPTLEESVAEKLNALLERYDGLLMFGNGTRQMEALRSNYLLLKRTAKLTQQICYDKKEHIYYYEDYCVYSLIDLAVERYQDQGNGDDVIYLTHPAIIQITRYDRQHGTNLRDTLYNYLLYDRNLVKTAAMTYMHRNTVINKINKVISLIQLDLDDPKLRQRLILSCQIIKYYENIMNMEIRL